MEASLTKLPSERSRATSRSSYSSLSSFADETPKKKKKVDRMVNSIDKRRFEWSQTQFKPITNQRQLSSSSSHQSNFEDYLSENLSDDSQSLGSFLEKSLKRAKNFGEKKRKISQEPFKKGFVPNWKDNYYTSLLDWGHQNLIFAAIDCEIYEFTMSSFDTKNSKVFVWPWMKGTKINAIKSSPVYSQVAVAYENGNLQVYDYKKKRALCLDVAHQSRITALDWNQRTILTGSKDNLVKMRDDRTFKTVMQFEEIHKQEVLGVKRSGNLIASGGNDNVVAIYDVRKSLEILTFYEHEAAVKALAWAKEDELLLSGGGTSDKMVKFWNHKEGLVTKEIETGSQVCNLVISKNTQEFVSCQGFSQNQIVLWNYEGQKMEILHGKHSNRVLYSCLSPCGQYLATGAGDAKLLIWKMFPCLERKNRIFEKTDLR